MLPNYNASQLEEILDEEIRVPSFMDEMIFQNDFKNNHRLHWQINYYLLNSESLQVLLSKSDFRQWKILRRVNWFMFIVVLGYYVYQECYSMLSLLLIYPFLTSSIISHRKFLYTAVFTAGCSFLFHFNTPDFWIAFVSTTLGYLLNKEMAGRVEQIIFEKAFRNIQSFWKFYSKKLILIEPFSSRMGYLQLINKYPQLLDDP